MEIKLPEWATKKEKEGMKAFLKIAQEYGQFEFEFKPVTFEDDIGFEVNVKWNPYGRGERNIPFSVYWNYEQLFNRLNEKIDTWQFVFADSGFTINGQLFYMELFQRLDEKLEVA